MCLDFTLKNQQNYERGKLQASVYDAYGLSSNEFAYTCAEKRGSECGKEAQCQSLANTVNHFLVEASGL